MIYDTLNVEDVEELMKVRAPFPFPSLMHPTFFHHRITRYCRHASGRFKENSQQKDKICDVAQNLARLKVSSSVRVMC